jgi:NAD(P)H-flavin reductase
VQLTAGAAPAGYFALANAPGRPAGVFEFLIRAGGAAADAIRALSAGASLLIGPPSGPGFPLEKARERDVVLLTMGSGISALRPVIQAISAERAAYGEVALLHGDRSFDRMPFVAEHAAWQDARIRVMPVFSREGGERRGHIHNHLDDIALGGAIVFLSGSKAMEAVAREALAQRGVGADRIFKNF